MPQDVPTDNDGRPKIVLRINLDDEGHLNLYDAVSGRSVAFQREVMAVVDNPDDDLQTVEFSVFADERMIDQEVIERAQQEGWEALVFPPLINSEDLVLGPTLAAVGEDESGDAESWFVAPIQKLKNLIDRPMARGEVHVTISVDGYEDVQQVAMAVQLMRWCGLVYGVEEMVEQADRVAEALRNLNIDANQRQN